MSFSTLSEKWADVPLFVATLALIAATGLQDLGVRRPVSTPLRSQQPLGLTIIVGVVRGHGQVAPARHPLQADPYDGPFGDLHRR